MSYSVTTATRKVAAMTKRIRAISGGTSASKTISVLLCLIDASQRDRRPTVTSVVSESHPHLKRGAMRDFQSIMEAQGYWNEARWNRTDCVYTFETGSRIEFFSADQPDKVRGPRRDRLFLNEANNLPFNTFDQLEVRTREYVFLDWNPVAEFWFYTDVQGKRDDIEFITLTYRDNEALDPAIVAAIEQRKNNPQWWKVYGEGLLGEAEGRIYTGWEIIPSVPKEARLERYGLDWGYSVDPTAIVALYSLNGGFVLDEACYAKMMSNRMIADILLALPKALIVADSAEPKSIDEIRGYGVTVVPSQKGAGSVSQGIQFVQDQRIMVTQGSLNLIREYRNYLWAKDRDGKPMNEPAAGADHCLDCVRYALESYRPKTQWTPKRPATAW
jgi:phage terminase large subunit